MLCEAACDGHVLRVPQDELVPLDTGMDRWRIGGEMAVDFEVLDHRDQEVETIAAPSSLHVQNLSV